MSYWQPKNGNITDSLAFSFAILSYQKNPSFCNSQYACHKKDSPNGEFVK